MTDLHIFHLVMNIIEILLIICVLPQGVLQKKKWENAMTIDKKAWGSRRDAQLSDFLTTEELIETLVTTVSCGGRLRLLTVLFNDARRSTCAVEPRTSLNQYL